MGEPTTKTELREWFDRGIEQGATHMIVACDTFDWEDYPVYVMPGEDPKSVVAKYDGPNMQKVMEVYSMKCDKEQQITEYRAFHYD